MDKQEIIERFCSLSTKVGEFFDSRFAHGCFCNENYQIGRFQFDEIIVKFIEMCVMEEMKWIENQPDEIDVQIAKLQKLKELKSWQ